MPHITLLWSGQRAIHQDQGSHICIRTAFHIISELITTREGETFFATCALALSQILCVGVGLNPRDSQFEFRILTNHMYTLNTGSSALGTESLGAYNLVLCAWVCGYAPVLCDFIHTQTHFNTCSQIDTCLCSGAPDNSISGQVSLSLTRM